VIEIQPNHVVSHQINPRVHRLTVFVLHLQFRANLCRNIFGEIGARHIGVGIRVQFAVAIRRADGHFFALANRHAVQLIFQAGDDVADALQKF